MVKTIEVGRIQAAGRTIFANRISARRPLRGAYTPVRIRSELLPAGPVAELAMEQLNRVR